MKACRSTSTERSLIKNSLNTVVYKFRSTSIHLKGHRLVRIRNAKVGSSILLRSTISQKPSHSRLGFFVSGRPVLAQFWISVSRAWSPVFRRFLPVSGLSPPISLCPSRERSRPRFLDWCGFAGRRLEVEIATLIVTSTRDSVQNSRKRGQSKEGSQRWMNP